MPRVGSRSVTEPFVVWPTMYMEYTVARSSQAHPDPRAVYGFTAAISAYICIIPTYSITNPQSIMERNFLRNFALIVRLVRLRAVRNDA